MSVHDGMRMYISPESYLLEASNKKEVLKIDRTDGDLSLLTALPTLTEREKIQDIHGIVGLITLQSSTFLIVITARKEVARLLSHPVYMATDFRIYPIPNDAKSLSSHTVEKTLLALLKSHLYSAPFYFSYGFDLTSTFQRQEAIKQQGGQNLPLWQRADERFFWNRYVASSLVDATTSGKADLSRFILPLVFGFLEIKISSINGRTFVYGLIGRRSRHRAGTRYFSRGIDLQGNVSNFNESEQFVIADPKGTDNGERARNGEGRLVQSFVQTRGSVPVFWAEVNNLRYKPDLLIMDKHETAEATALHFDNQVKLYGDIFVANTVNQKGYEKPVKDAYERAIEELNNPRVTYTYFDFHHECKGMKFGNVMKLVETLNKKGFAEDNFFAKEEGDGVQKTQKGVIRTNCMDCLDRTNVVQSTVARWMLNTQLKGLEILGPNEKLEDHTKFWFTFRNVWADHADVVSKAYSGTGALKTDFTRTGKRTYEGALQDGVNSLTRYVRNNYFDGSRQDAFDLFTGSWTPRKGIKGNKRAMFLRALPYAWVFTFFLFLYVLYGSFDSSSIPKPVALGILVALNLCLMHFITERGLEYVNWPTLNRPEETMYYDGPGYSSGRHGRAAVPSHFRGNSSKPSTTSRNVRPVAAQANGRRGYAAQEE